MSFTDGKSESSCGSMIKTGQLIYTKGSCHLLMVSQNLGEDPGLKTGGYTKGSYQLLTISLNTGEDLGLNRGQLIYTKGLCHLLMVSLNLGEDPGLKQGVADIHQRMSFTDGKSKSRGGSMIKTGGATPKDHVIY